MKKLFVFLLFIFIVSDTACFSGDKNSKYIKPLKTDILSLRFRNFEAKSIRTSQLVLKFKTFKQKEISVKALEMKFCRFKPKIVLTELLVIKFKKAETD